MTTNAQARKAVERVNRTTLRLLKLRNELYRAEQANRDAWRALERAGVSYRITGNDSGDTVEFIEESA